MTISAQASVGHYENFPVASWILPKRFRPSVQALYRFARTADDLADEGDATADERLQPLTALLASFERHYKNPPATHPQPMPPDPWQDVSAPMAALCRQGLPADYPRALISAFMQDVRQKRYASTAALADYAARSANPVGRCLLYFFAKHDAEACQASDAICSALQYINFWQDLAIDWQKERLYIPADTLQQFGFSATGDDSVARFVAGEPINAAWRALMQKLLTEARTLMLTGAKLPRHIGGRAGFELALVMEGGLRIVEKIAQVEGDVFRHRPTLNKMDGALMMVRALRRFML